MKKVTLIFILIPLLAQAADWDLFRLHQSSYYKYPYYNSTNVGVQVMDSVKQNGNEDIFYFHRNLEYENAGQCYQSAYNSFPFPNGDYVTIDSLVQRNDTVYFEWYYSTLPFYFLPKAIVGQSWTVTSTYSGNDYNQITITCASIQEETFFRNYR